MNKSLKAKIKNRLCLLVALCVACVCLPAAAMGEEEALMTMMGLDADSGNRSWETNLFFSRMAEKTGVSFTFDQYVTQSDYEKEIERLSSRAEDKLPDVLFKAGLTEADQRRLGADGTLMDLKPLLAQYAPNITALLEEHPEWEKAITLPDGKIVALPLFNTMERQIGLWVNRQWLDVLGLEMPTDADSLYAVLQAFKTGDPNQNGKNDEIPLNITGVWEMRWLLGLFGIVADDYNLTMQDGQVLFAPKTEGYRDFVVYLKKLYDEGLMSEGAFRDYHGMAALNEKESNPIVSGALLSVTPYTQVADTAVTDYALMISSGGTWRDMLGEVWGGTFAITKACTDVEGALRWVDEMYAGNATLAYAGVEGEDYTMDENGWTWILDTYRTVDNIRAESIIYTSGTIPGLVPSAFMHQANSVIDRHVTLHSDALKETTSMALPARILTDSEDARVREIQGALGEAVDVGIARFVTGEVELDDENWNAYIARLDELGAQELTEIFQGVVTR